MTATKAEFTQLIAHFDSLFNHWREKYLESYRDVYLYPDPLLDTQDLDWYTFSCERIDFIKHYNVPEELFGKDDLALKYDYLYTTGHRDGFGSALKMLKLMIQFGMLTISE